MTATTRNDSAHRAILTEIHKTKAAAFAAEGTDDAEVKRAAFYRAVHQLTTLPAGGAGEFFVSDQVHVESGRPLRTLWRHRRRVAQCLDGDGWNAEAGPEFVAPTPEQADADREEFRAVERERQATYKAALSDVAQFLWNHPKAAAWLAVRVEVGHLYDAPFVVGLEHKPGPRGGTVALTGVGAKPVSARGALRSAARGFPWLADAVNALCALALAHAVGEAGDEARFWLEEASRSTGFFPGSEINQAQRHLQTVEADFASAEDLAGPGWEARAKDALAQAGATKIIPF